MTPTRSVADLRPGEHGIIKALGTLGKLSLKLMEMGCLPGEKVTLNFKAPLGDPLCIRVSGYDLSLRRDEASLIALE